MKNSLQTFSSFLRRFASGTLISRFTGFGREIAMASFFGVNALVANFWLSFRFAHLLRRFVAEGAMHVSVLPHFTQLKEKDPKEAAYFFYELSFLVTIALLFLVVMADSAILYLLWQGYFAESTRHILTFTLLLSPSLIFISLYGLNCSFLHSENRFFIASASPAVVNMIWIGSALFFASQELYSALQGVAMAVVLGFGLQYIVTLPSLFAFFSKYQVRADRQKSREMRKEIGRMLKPFCYATLGVMATQINSALDMLFAKAAHPEGPAYLWYALRLQQLPLALFGVGLASVVLPSLSKNQDLSQKEGIMHFALTKACVLMIPITAAYLVLAPSMVQLTFGHGKFTAEACTGTAFALALYALALLPMTLVLIVACWFYAKKETKVPASAAALSVVVNMGLNALFVYVIHLGVASVALATSISAFFNLIYLSYFLRKEGVDLFSSLTKVIVKTLLCTLIAAVGTWMVRGLYGPTFTKELFVQVRRLAIEGGLFTALFLSASHLFKLKEFNELYRITSK